MSTKILERKVTMADIKRAVHAAGGIVEEDTGHLVMRCIQVCAPWGKLWAGTGNKCEPMDWAQGNSPRDISYNVSQLANLQDTLRHGLRNMTEQEREDYDELGDENTPYHPL